MKQFSINKKQIHTIIVQVFWEFFGSLLIAIGIYNFAVRAEFPMTGFSGISIILYQLFGFPIGLSTIMLNVPVAFLCYRLLGRKFLISSIRCLMISSIFIDYIGPLFPVYEGSRLLAALCTGVIAGIGYAIIYMRNSSTGGSDFIIMAVKALKPHISLGKIAFLSDIGIILIGGIIFRDMDGIIYGMIVNYLFAWVVDKMMYGINAGKISLIVTCDGKKICRIIDDCIGRGTTILSAYGGFKHERKQVVMCACNNKEMYMIQQAVKENDPEAFFIVLESNEVHGEGFQMVKVGETS